MPRPIRFDLRATIPQSPDDIAAIILDLDNWTKFDAWGPLPGIRSATFEHRTDAVVATRIRCVNTDGSTHTETITAWDLPREIRLRLDTFSKPLARFATHFDEAWLFEPAESDQSTRVRRTFELHPTSAATRPLVRLIALMLRQSIRKQFRQLRTEPQA